jgi:hypothetical protein
MHRGSKNVTVTVTWLRPEPIIKHPVKEPGVADALGALGCINALYDVTSLSIAPMQC